MKKKLLIIILILIAIIIPMYLNMSRKILLIQSSENPNYYYAFDDFQNYYIDSTPITDDIYNKLYSNTYASPDGRFMISNYRDGVCINQYLGDEKDVIIPETIDGKKVLKIGGYALYWGSGYENSDIMYSLQPAFCQIDTPEDENWYNEKIESITIPQYVKEIYIDSFQYTVNLKKIIVADENPVFKSIGGKILLSKEGNHLLWESIGLSYFDLSSKIIYPEINSKS